MSAIIKFVAPTDLLFQPGHGGVLPRHRKKKLPGPERSANQKGDSGGRQYAERHKRQRKYSFSWCS